MNDYVQRSDISPVDRGTPVPATPPVAPVAAARSGNSADAALDNRTRAVPIDSGEGADIDAGVEDQLASAAEYARVNAEVADILASIRATGSSAQSIASAEAALTALTPIIIVPLPPASKDMVEQVARIAQRIVDQAALAQGAQANLKPGTVDQILAQVA
ncbi:hypothetical protein [Sphingobium algorifonticola]|uniref:Uncharacterized protein n=1 Tax=Sphingobium algorifonticola TaxID=2008318 RepID=A0A437JBR7_9SPHN|nr:hypothetical protein [Sphingobium algorifonticola]RVT43325.1 hypothetical protein ENE74_01440 [Sphingobium algorifonticola]